MENKKIHTVGTIPNSKKVVERVKHDTHKDTNTLTFTFLVWYRYFNNKKWRG